MLKGGRLVREAAPARVLALVLSNVADSAPEIVASGPTAPDPTRFGDALAVLKRYDLWKQVPLATRGWLDRGRCGEIEDTPDKTDPVFLGTTHVVIGDGEMAARAACVEAERLGYEAQVLSTTLGGTADEAGGFLAETARIVRASQSPGPRPTCLVTTGETTVRGPSRDYGDRNQQLALAAALKIDRMDGVLVASMGTDGFDGSTDAAGATATGSTAERAREAGLDCEAALARGDAYSIFERLDDRIISGPTGTDVADIQVVLMA
jgi:hydroxypyruvate reductase